MFALQGFDDDGVAAVQLKAHVFAYMKVQHVDNGGWNGNHTAAARLAGSPHLQLRMHVLQYLPELRRWVCAAAGSGGKFGGTFQKTAPANAAMNAGVKQNQQFSVKVVCSQLGFQGHRLSPKNGRIATK